MIVSQNAAQPPDITATDHKSWCSDHHLDASCGACRNHPVNGHWDGVKVELTQQPAANPNIMIELPDGAWTRMTPNEALNVAVALIDSVSQAGAH